MPAGLNQLWVADITYIAIAVGFVYLVAILDAWSHRDHGRIVTKRFIWVLFVVETWAPTEP